ncbi:MAG: 3-dehydroquinate synthase, partial [Eubacteriales bacterium]|nr:3-dehydroquinate synthase [Eubacteriales bacterium]
MANRMSVHQDGKIIYDIVLQPSFEQLGREVSALGVSGRKLCIVTDSNVAPLYLEEVRQQLVPWCRAVHTFTFPAGEEHKNLDTVRELYCFLIENQYDRSDMLVA